MGFDAPHKVKPVGAEVQYYAEGTTTTLYVANSLGDGLDSITLKNDSTTDTIQVSYDGASLEGDLKPGEPITLSVKGKRTVYVKGTAGGGNYRLWGY